MAGRSVPDQVAQVEKVNRHRKIQRALAHNWMADNVSVSEIGRRLGVPRSTVARWKKELVPTDGNRDFEKLKDDPEIDELLKELEVLLGH